MTIMLRKFAFLALLQPSLAVAMLAQDLPNCNIYLFKTEWRDSVLSFSEPQFLTGFNRAGYNNQPAFLSNTELLVTVGMAGESQTDIYLLDLEKRQKMRLTKTAESEFSPKPTPDNLYFSVVRVELDEGRTQRLWQYPLDRKDGGKAVFKFLRGVGYYHWLDPYKVAIFNVSEANYLSLGDTRDGSTQYLAPAIGRCFGTSPNGRLVFLHKVTAARHVIKAMDKNTQEAQEISLALEDAEDFVIMADGSMLMGKGSRIFRMHPLRKKDSWEEVVDLKSLGINNINRMAISKDGKLAVVSGG